MTANKLELLPDGPQAREALFDLIETAQAELRLLFYIFEPDGTGEAVRDALIRARRRGVQVWLTIDDFGSIRASDEFMEPLVESGATFCRFVPHFGRRYLLRNHQKMAVADGSRAIIGGFNIADTYFDPNLPDSWRDLGLSIEGPAVAQLSRYYDRLFDWTRQKHSTIRTLRRMLRELSDDDGPLRWLFSGLAPRAGAYPHQLRADFARASRLDVMMAYFAPNPRVLRSIGRIAERGQVRLITPSKTDVPMMLLAARHTYRRLLGDGVRIFEYQPRALHAKLIIVDDIVYIGSGNLDMRSLYINLEVMLRIEDPDFAAQARALFEQALEESEPIDQATHQRDATWLNRLRWSFAYFLLATVDPGLARRLAS